MHKRKCTIHKRRNSGGAWRPVLGTSSPAGTTTSSTRTTPVPRPIGSGQVSSPATASDSRKVKEMHDEEVVRAADRNVDLVYSSFKDDFNRMQGAITEGLSYCLTKSKGKLYPQVNEFQRQNDMICQSIAYTHKQGIGNELENSKRQEAYVEYKKQMEELVSRVAHLVGMAQQYY